MSSTNSQIRGQSQANAISAIIQDDSDESLLILETDENNDDNENQILSGQQQQFQRQGNNNNTYTYNGNSNMKRDQSIKQRETNTSQQCQAVLSEILELLKSDKQISSKHWKNLEQKLSFSFSQMQISGYDSQHSQQACLVKIIRLLNSVSLIQIEIMGNPSLAQLILQSCEYFTSLLVDTQNGSNNNHLGISTRNGNIGFQVTHNNKKHPTHDDAAVTFNDMTSLTLNSQGTVSRRKGEFKKALELFQNAVSLGGLYLGLSYLNLSVLYSSLGNHNLSLEAANNALIEQQRIFVVAADRRESKVDGVLESEERQRQANTLVQAYFNIAVEMEHLQRYDEALRHYENSYLCSQKHLGKKSSITAQFFEEFKLFQSRFTSLNNNNNLQGSNNNNFQGSNNNNNTNLINNFMNNSTKSMRQLINRSITVRPNTVSPSVNNNNNNTINSLLNSTRIPNTSPNRKNSENYKLNFVSSSVLEYPSPQLHSSLSSINSSVRRRKCNSSSRQRFSLGQPISNPSRNNGQSQFLQEKQHSQFHPEQQQQQQQQSSLSSSQSHLHIDNTHKNMQFQQFSQTPSVGSSSSLASSVPYIFPDSKKSRIKQSLGVRSSGSSNNIPNTSILHSTRNVPSANFSFKPNGGLSNNSSFHNNLGISSGSQLISSTKIKTPFKEQLEEQCAVNTLTTTQKKKNMINGNNSQQKSFFHFADVEMLKKTSNVKMPAERDTKQQCFPQKIAVNSIVDRENHDGIMSSSAITGQSQQQQQLGSLMRISSTPRNRKKIVSSRQQASMKSCSPPSSSLHLPLRPASSSSSIKLSLRHSHFAETTIPTQAVSFKDTNDTELLHQQQSSKEHITNPNSNNSGSFNVLKMLQLKDCLAASAKLVEQAILLKEKKHQCAKHRRIKRLSLQGHFKIADDDNDDDQGATAAVGSADGVTSIGTVLDKGSEIQALHRTDSEDKCQECESPLRSSSYTKHGLKLLQRTEDAKMSCSEKITEESGTLQFWQVGQTHLIASFITYQENSHDSTATTMASNLAQRSHNNSNSNISAACPAPHMKNEIHNIPTRSHPKGLFLHCFDASFMDSPGALLISSPIHQEISQILPLLLNKLISSLQINEDHDCLSLKPSPGNPLRFLLPGGLSFRMFKITDKFSSIAALPRQNMQSSSVLASLSSVISSVKNQSSTESPHSINMDSSSTKNQHKSSLIIKTIQKIKCDQESNAMSHRKMQKNSQEELEDSDSRNPSNSQIPNMSKVFMKTSSTNNNQNNHRLSRESILKMLEIKKTQSLFQLGRSQNLQEINEIEELKPIFPRENYQTNGNNQNQMNNNSNSKQDNKLDTNSNTNLAEEANLNKDQLYERELPARSISPNTNNNNNNNNPSLSSSLSSPPSSTSISSGSISPLLASKPQNIPNLDKLQNPQEFPAQPSMHNTDDKPVVSQKLIHSSLHHQLSINTQFKPHATAASTPLIPLPVSETINTSNQLNEIPSNNNNNITKAASGGVFANSLNNPNANTNSIPNPSLPPQVLHQISSTTSAGSPYLIGINSPLMPGILSPLVTPTNNIHNKGNYSSQTKPSNQASNFQQGLSSPFSQVSGSSTNIIAGIGSPQNPLGVAAATQNQLIKQFQDCSPINALGSPITSFYEQDPTFTTYWKDISQNVSDLNRQNASPTMSVLSKLPSQQMAGLSQKSIECYPPGIQQETIQQVQQLKSIINQNKAFQRMEMMQNGGNNTNNTNNTNTISNNSDVSRKSSNNLQQQQQQQQYHQGDFSKSLQQQQYIQMNKSQPYFQQSQVNNNGNYQNQQSQQYRQQQQEQYNQLPQNQSNSNNNNPSYQIHHSSSNMSIGSSNNNNNNIYNNINPYNNVSQKLKLQQSTEQQQYQDQQRDHAASNGNNAYLNTFNNNNSMANSIKRDNGNSNNVNPTIPTLGQTQVFQNRNLGREQSSSYQQQQSQQQPQEDNRDNGTTTTNNNVNGSSNTSLSPANGVYGISNTSSSPANNVFIGQNIVQQNISNNNNNNNNSLPQESKQSMSLSGISRNNDNQQGSLFESKDNDSNDFFKHQESSSSKLKSHASISILPLTNTISSKNELPNTQQQRRYSQFYLQQQLALAVANLETSQEPVSMISERKDESTQAIVSNNRLQFEPQQASPAVSSSNTNNQSPQFQSENQLETQQQQIIKFQMMNQPFPSGISSQLQKQLQLQDRVEIRQIDSKIENEEEAADRSVSVSNILNNKELREKKQTDNSIQQSPLLNKTVIYEAKDVASQNGEDDDDNDDCDDDYEENKLLHAKFEKGMITRVESENELFHEDNSNNNNNNNVQPTTGNINNNTRDNQNNGTPSNTPSNTTNNVLSNQANFDISSIKIWKGDGVQRHSMDSNSNLFGAPISNISRINKVPSVDNTDNFDGLEGSSCEVADFQNGSMNNPPNIRSTSSLAQQSNQKLSSNNNIVSQSSQDEETSKLQRQSTQTQVQIEQLQLIQQQQSSSTNPQQQSPTSQQQQSTTSMALSPQNTQNQQPESIDEYQQQQDNLKLEMEKLEQKELLLNNGEFNPRSKQIQLIRNTKKKPSVPMIIISKVSSASEDDEDEDDEDYDSQNENNQSQDNDDEDESEQSEDESEDSELDSPVQDLPVSLSKSDNNPDIHAVQVPSSLSKLAKQQSLQNSQAPGQSQSNQNNANATEVAEINNNATTTPATAVGGSQNNPADVPPTTRSRTQSKGGTGTFQMTDSQKPGATKIHEKRESLMFAGLFRSRAESLMITRDENRSLTPKIKERRDSMLNGDIISFQNQLQIIEQATKQYQQEQLAEQKNQHMNMSSPQKTRRESNRFTYGIADLALPTFTSKMSRIEENHADSEYVDSECDDKQKKHHRSNNNKLNESPDKNGNNCQKENTEDQQIQEQSGLGTFSKTNIPNTPIQGASRFHPHNRVKELRLQAMHGQLSSGDNHDQQSPYFNLDSNKKGTNSEDDQQNSQNSRDGSSKQQQQQQQQQQSQQSISQQSSQQKLVSAYEPVRKKVFTFDFHKQDTLTKTKNSQPSLSQLAEINMQHSNTLTNNSINSKNNKSSKSILNKDSSNDSGSDSGSDS